MATGVSVRLRTNGTAGYRSSSTERTFRTQPAAWETRVSGDGFGDICVSTRPIPAGGDWTDMGPVARNWRAVAPDGAVAVTSLTTSWVSPDAENPWKIAAAV